MKRKLTQQATITTDDDDAVVAAKKHKNLRSNLPRRKRSHISPIIFNISTSKPALLLSTHHDDQDDDVSCNTTLESVVLPPNAVNDVIVTSKKPPLKKGAAGGGAVSSENNNYSCVESCSIALPSELSAVLNSPSTATVDQPPAKVSGDLIGILGSDHALTCTEEFSYEDYEVSSEFQSEIYSGEDYSDQFEDDEFSDGYTPSIWLNSGSQFSEKSFDDDSTPSPCFSLFKEFHNQFLKLSSYCCSDFEVSSLLNDEYSDELAYRRFEDDEDEESYRMLRSRERNQAAKVKDYVEDYDFATEFDALIVEQRLLMVNWIIEVSHKKELQNETMFLGVRLFDRFLNNGFFATRRNLQLLGIACLTLAIRIEENQPYNSVRQRAFYVGSNVYGRTEVVAMEWVVQEVLKFHCLSPTIHNFLCFYLKAATANEEMRRKAKYLASLALLDHRQLQFWPSTVAAAVVILVSLSRNQDESCQRVVQAHVRTKIDDLPECIKSLEWLVKYAP